jgi:tetratricopeptide (TPR) repeat protein
LTRKTHKTSRAVSQPDRSIDPVILFLHSTAMMGDERWDEAIATLQRFLEWVDKPADRWIAYQNLGACYLALDRFDEALAALDEVQHIQPGESEAIYNRGVICACASRFPEAVAAFELYMRNWPDLARQREVQFTLRKLRRIESGKLPPGTYLLEHLQEQISYNLEVADFHLVENKARRMIALVPDRGEGHFALGLACLELGCYLEALEAFQAALLREPDYGATLYNIGQTYLKLNQPEIALSWLERAQRREPKDLATMHQLGVACERLKQREDAVRWWKRALKIDSHYEMAQWRLHEIGEGPEPAKPLSPNQKQLHAMTPIVKARMRKPQVFRNGGVTLTYDEQVGFVLEDTGNPLNGTIHAGGPFKIAEISDEDLLDLLGLTKMVLRLINAHNTRDIAVLAYYEDDQIFNYQARFDRSKRIDFDSHGHFVITEVPRFFKLRMESDLATPYGNPMQGKLLYLNQFPRPGILISTLGVEHYGT